MAEISAEMRIFSGTGERLYLTEAERHRFLKSTSEESRENRILCSVLHYTGCRPSEALELTPSKIMLTDRVIVFRSLKKRKHDNQGNIKLPQYRSIPVPDRLIEELDLVFDLRRIAKTGKGSDELLWSISRATAWRMVKKVMNRASIKGKQATSKGLRHGFGIAMLSGERALPITILRDLMGHSDSKITEIYLQAVGAEKRNMVMNAWQ